MKSQIHELISLFNKGVSKTTIITGVLSALLLLSCNTSLTLEKRKYTGGFYVQINGPKKNISDDSSLPDKQSVSANTPLLPSSVSTEQKIYESKSEKKSVKPKRKISKNNQDANLANSGISKKKNIGNGKINQSKNKPFSYHCFSLNYYEFGIFYWNCAEQSWSYFIRHSGCYWSNRDDFGHAVLSY